MKTANKFLKLCEVAVRPLKSCNKRGRANCWILFKGMFGSPKQMGLILAKTFDGEQRWIPSTDGIEIDAMFFTATSERP